jgi:deoxyribose-phosphate aldolase
LRPRDAREETIVISNAVQVPPPLSRYEDLAKMIDHSLVRPELTDDEVMAGCELARKYDVATVSVRPCDVEMAARVLAGSAVKVGR